MAPLFPTVGDRRVYEVSVDGVDGVDVAMTATWTLVVVKMSGATYELLADLDVTSLSVNEPALAHVVAEVIGELSRPYSLLVGAGGYPLNVFAIEHRQPLAADLFACCIGALIGMQASIGTTIRVAEKNEAAAHQLPLLARSL